MGISFLSKMTSNEYSIVPEPFDDPAGMHADGGELLTDSFKLIPVSLKGIYNSSPSTESPEFFECQGVSNVKLAIAYCTSYCVEKSHGTIFLEEGRIMRNA
jgi:hypothetical protein